MITGVPLLTVGWGLIRNVTGREETGSRLVRSLDTHGAHHVAA
jgi:hypothetical protein